MSYDKKDEVKGLIGIVGAMIIMMMVCQRGCAQVNSITEDATGVSITHVPPIHVTIYTANGQTVNVIAGDVLAAKYDVKSIPTIFNGDLVRVDSTSIENVSGLLQKRIYITKLD